MPKIRDICDLTDSEIKALAVLDEMGPKTSLKALSERLGLALPTVQTRFASARSKLFADSNVEALAKWKAMND